jgi:hypothetical protein
MSGSGMSEGTDGTGSAEELAAENARLKEELERQRGERGAVRARKVRRVLTVILVVLTSLSVVASTVGVWFDRTIWNTDRYVALVAPLASDPAVTGPLAIRLTDEVFTALDLEQRVGEVVAAIPKLPSQAQFLVGPITNAMHNFVLQQVSAFLASQTFRDLWVQLNTRAHEKIVALLQGDYAQLPNVSIQGGQVQLNLIPAVFQVIKQLIPALGINVTLPDLPANLDTSGAISFIASHLGVSLPPDFGQLTIMSQDQLSTYQTAARNVHRLAYALVALSVVLFALTLVVAVNRRRALIWLGLGIAVGLLIGGPTIRAIEGQIGNAITSQGGRAAARDVFAQVTTGLRHLGVLIVVVGLLVALVAHLAGRPAWFESAKAKGRELTARRPEGSELEAFAARNADRLKFGAIAVAVVLLVLIGFGWISVIVIGALLALVLWGVFAAERKVGREAA